VFRERIENEALVYGQTVSLAGSFSTASFGGGEKTEAAAAGSDNERPQTSGDQ
jgi:hypothetical protein